MLNSSVIGLIREGCHGNQTFSHNATWIELASEVMSVTTWLVVELPAVWLSKKPTSCLRAAFRYSILTREVCLSTVLAQHSPSARANADHNAVRKIGLNLCANQHFFQAKDDS